MQWNRNAKKFGINEIRIGFNTNLQNINDEEELRKRWSLKKKGGGIETNKKEKKTHLGGEIRRESVDADKIK